MAAPPRSLLVVHAGDDVAAVGGEDGKAERVAERAPRKEVDEREAFFID